MNNRVTHISVWTVLLLFLLNQGESAKILVLIPMATHSEQHFVLPIVKELANRGHHLTLVTNREGSVSHPNITEVIPISLAEVFGNYTDTKITQGMFWDLLFWDMQTMIPVWDQIYTSPEFKKLFTQKFDVVFINNFFEQAFLGLIHRMGVPYISIHTLGLNNFRGSPFGYYMPTSHIPHPLIEYTDKMNFPQRVLNFIVDWATRIYANFYHYPVIEAVYRKHLGQDIPSIKEIERDQQGLQLTNTHFLTNFHRPLMPDVVEVGGIHCQPAKPLPEDLENLLNKTAAPEGFIYFSLGSVLDPSTFPESLKRVFINVFSRLKQKVVWKWDGEDLGSMTKNIVTRKWLPQQDLLGHPNIRLFITHGGLLSTQQTVYHGTPALVFPFWFDQGANAKGLGEKQVAIPLDLWSLTEEKLEATIKQVVNDSGYKTRMQTLSAVFKNQPQTPLNRATYWIEHILKFKGAPHLRSSARQLNTIQQHSLDVITFLLVTLSITITVVFVVIKKAIKFGLLGAHSPSHLKKKIN